MTIEDLLRIRWNALNAEIPFAPSNAIVQFWRQHPELGSPLTNEVPFEDGGGETGVVAQVFANGIVRWSASEGASLVE